MGIVVPETGKTFVVSPAINGYVVQRVADGYVYVFTSERNLLRFLMETVAPTTGNRNNMRDLVDKVIFNHDKPDSELSDEDPSLSQFDSDAQVSKGTDPVARRGLRDQYHPGEPHMDCDNES